VKRYSMRISIISKNEILSRVKSTIAWETQNLM
jgi:hypothetical protein